MSLIPFNIVVKAVQQQTGSVVHLHLRMDATDRKTAEEFIVNWFMQSAGRSVQDTLPHFMDLHFETEEVQS